MDRSLRARGRRVVGSPRYFSPTTAGVLRGLLGPVAAYGVAVGAAGGAVALPSAAAEVAERGAALLECAAAQPGHAAAREVQCGADGDQRPQHPAERQVGVAVVDVPAVARVVGQPRV